MTDTNNNSEPDNDLTEETAEQITRGIEAYARNMGSDYGVYTPADGEPRITITTIENLVELKTYLRRESVQVLYLDWGQAAHMAKLLSRRAAEARFAESKMKAARSKDWNNMFKRIDELLASSWTKTETTEEDTTDA